ncbi:MAG TPA: hypothetical protein VGK48_09700 [Terriglobia bacterium]
MKWIESVLRRRSFIAGIGGAVALAGHGSTLEAQPLAAAGWEPAHEAKDEWLDKVPGKHRMMFDSTTPDAFGSALMYAGNYYLANRDGYGLQDSDLAVVIIARHHATPFSFNDAMWSKYSATLFRLSNFMDPKTKQAPVRNVYMGTGGSLDGLVGRGLHLAVCQMATREMAGSMAQDAGTDEDAVFNELSRNLVPNSHLVPAGIVAVNRAQEHGYAFVNA